MDLIEWAGSAAWAEWLEQEPLDEWVEDYGCRYPCGCIDSAMCSDAPGQWDRQFVQARRRQRQKRLLSDHWDRAHAYGARPQGYGPLAYGQDRDYDVERFADEEAHPWWEGKLGRYWEAMPEMEGAWWDSSKNCTYGTAHLRAKELWGAPATECVCMGCGRRGRQFSYLQDSRARLQEWRKRKDGKWYVMDHSPFPEDYVPLCRTCHRALDDWKVPRDDRALDAMVYRFRAREVGYRLPWVEPEPVFAELPTAGSVFPEWCVPPVAEPVTWGNPTKQGPSPERVDRRIDQMLREQEEALARAEVPSKEDLVAENDRLGRLLSRYKARRT